MYSKFKVGNHDIEVDIDTYDSVLSWADLVQQNNSQPVVICTFRRNDGQADTPPPDGFNYFSPVPPTGKGSENSESNDNAPPPIDSGVDGSGSRETGKQIDDTTVPKGNETDGTQKPPEGHNNQSKKPTTDGTSGEPEQPGIILS